MRLSEIPTGEKAFIKKITGRSSFKRRMGEMGFVKGKEISVIKNAPLKDPIEYSILGYAVSLRRSDAQQIEVTRQFNHIPVRNLTNLHTGTFHREQTGFSQTQQKLKVAFVGNPNSGKTTLYNAITRSNEHTGNYSGVTVDIKSANLKFDNRYFHITDLPGTYSISAYSPEELFVRDYIIKENPDVVVNVVDASNLERNLYFTTQLIDMGVNVVIALNMYDELEKRNDNIDFVQLGKMLGIPIIPTVGAKNRGVAELLAKVIEVKESPVIEKATKIDYGTDIEQAIAKIESRIKDDVLNLKSNTLTKRFIALRLLQKDRHIENYIIECANSSEILNTAKKEADKLTQLHNDDPGTLITDAKYGFIAGAVKQTFIPGAVKKRELTEILDGFLTHRLFGIPIFLFFLWLMFNATFTLGQYPQMALEWGISELSKLIDTSLANGSFKDLLVDGVIGGVGGVIVFLPNILILFLFISFFEDSGYMARVVFIMDKIMRRIGLHGKSFIPLIMGFGCNVPAIMASRAIEDKNSRMITMLINPFMSCSARLPVYLLLIGAVFPNNRGSLLFAIYLSGVALAVILAIIFRKFFFKSKPLPFVLELPPYRVPTLKSVTKHMWFKGSQYLKKMGGIILVASILVWGLGYFPRNIEIPAQLKLQQGEIELAMEQALKDGSQDQITDAEIQLKKINAAIKSYRLQESYIGKLGYKIEHVFKPLGFDWKMSVSLLSGVAAKEIVVSTMGVLYQVDVDYKGGVNQLAQTLQNTVYTQGELKGKKVFNPLATLAFLAFTLIYFPCIAVIAAIKKEANSMGWALFTIVYTTGLAWLLAFLVYQIGSLFI